MFNDVSPLPKYIDRSYYDYIMKKHEISNMLKQFESNIYLRPSETEKFLTFTILTRFTMFYLTIWNLWISLKQQCLIPSGELT